MTKVSVPPYNVPISGTESPSTEYYNFFETIQNALVTRPIDDGIGALSVRVAKLEQHADRPHESGAVRGMMSIHSDGLLQNGIVYLTLAGDSESPDATYFYGTDGTGAKGFHAVSDALAVSTNLTKTVGTDGVSTFDLSDVTLTTGGALKKYAFDAKGRLSASDDASIGDLSDVDTTTTAPTDKQVLTWDQTSGLWVPKTAISGVSHDDSQGIVLTGDGTPASKLKATPIISAVTGNKLSVKSDGMFADSGGIHIDNRVDTYGDLPSPPAEGTGATYLVGADGLLYVWDGSAWPAEGKGESVRSYDLKSWRLRITDTNGGKYKGNYTVECAAVRMALSSGCPIDGQGTPFATLGSNSVNRINAILGVRFESFWADDSATSRAAIDAKCGYLGLLGTVDEVRITARANGWNATIRDFHPRDFDVQSSTDSTDGLDGTWTTEWSVTGVTGWTRGITKTFVRP